MPGRKRRAQPLSVPTLQASGAAGDVVICVLQRVPGPSLVANRARGPPRRTSTLHRVVGRRTLEHRNRTGPASRRGPRTGRSRTKRRSRTFRAHQPSAANRRRVARHTPSRRPRASSLSGSHRPIRRTCLARSKTVSTEVAKRRSPLRAARRSALGDAIAWVVSVSSGVRLQPSSHCLKLALARASPVAVLLKRIGAGFARSVSVAPARRASLPKRPGMVDSCAHASDLGSSFHPRPAINGLDSRCRSRT
jgi:hypothetical protein